MQRGGCFNPCCLGSVSSTREILHLCILPFLVSILVVLDQSLRRYSSDVVVPNASVSILVVLDQSLRPCDRGRSPVSARRVSILVVLDQSLRPGEARLDRLTDGSFNPCCLGSVSSTGHMGHMRSGVFGFNPCCLGSVSSTLRYYDPAPDPAEFQSLLSWISLFDQHSHRGRGEGTRFNPCCLGSVSSTPDKESEPTPIPWFQSLLSWISLFDG